MANAQTAAAPVAPAEPAAATRSTLGSDATGDIIVTANRRSESLQRVPIAVTDDLNLLAHVDYSYISNYTISPLVQPFTETSPMGLHSTNAKLGIDDIPLGSARGYFGVYGRNIFNVADDSFTFNTGTNHFTVAPGGSGYAVAPRTYGLEARIKF